MPKFTQAELDRIELADAQRRLERTIQELQDIATRSIDPYHWSRGITGTPSNGNRQYRASDDCWALGLSNPGLAVAQDDHGRKHGHSVKVIKDGTTTIKPVSSFRKRVIHARQRATVVAEAPTRKMAADMAPIGDQNH